MSHIVRVSLGVRGKSHFVLLLIAAVASAAAGASGDSPPTSSEEVVAPLPADILADPDLAQALSTSHEGLVEEALPGGGYRLDLRGRFQLAVFARIDAKRKVSVTHEVPIEVLLQSEGGACQAPDLADPESVDARR